MCDLISQNISISDHDLNDIRDPMTYTIEPACVFIDSIISLLEKERIALDEELLPHINMYSVIKSTIMNDGIWVDSVFWGIRDPLNWVHCTELCISKQVSDDPVFVVVVKAKIPDNTIMLFQENRFFYSTR